jgi:hypothetical protein
VSQDFEHLDEDLTITELGEHLGRGFAEADLSTFEALLLGAADALLQEMAEGGEDEEVANAAVDRFRASAREWVRVSTGVSNTTPAELSWRAR